MANFAERADIAALLQVEITTAAQIAAANWALTEASAAIRVYCRQYIELVADDEITLDVPPFTDRLLLPELPVVSVASVVENRETLTVDDDYKLGQGGILHRIGANWAEGVQTVTITYTHGYATLPDVIVSVCARAASRVYQAGLKSAESEAIPGVASKSLGDFSVSYTSESVAQDGIMGVSAARMLLLSEKDMLNYYRM